MNVVDSSGWLEYFAGGPNARFFSKPIEATAELIVPALSLYEVFTRVLQPHGEGDALQAVAIMQQGRVRRSGFTDRPHGRPHQSGPGPSDGGQRDARDGTGLQRHLLDARRRLRAHAGQTRTIVAVTNLTTPRSSSPRHVPV